MGMSKKRINIAILEDDKGQQRLYKDIVDEFNSVKEETHYFDCHITDNVSEICAHLFKNPCDCIIADIDINGSVDEGSGNELINLVLNKKRIPVIVNSGDIAKLDVDESKHMFLDINDRSDFDIYKGLQDIKKKYETGFTSAIGDFGKLDDAIRDIFWKHLKSDMNIWSQLDFSVKQKRLLRFILTRVVDSLDIDNRKSDEYNSIEFYIKRFENYDKINSGDIIEHCVSSKMGEKRYFVVVNAQCDIEQGNVDNYVLCEISTKEVSKWKTSIEKSGSISKNLKDKVIKYVNNAKSRYHLLPPTIHFVGGIIDFQSVFTIPKERINIQEYNVVASITNEFSKDIRFRFTAYYGRQGQPQLELNDVINSLIF